MPYDQHHLCIDHPPQELEDAALGVLPEANGEGGFIQILARWREHGAVAA